MSDGKTSLDKYYTKDIVVDECLSKIQGKLDGYDFVIEPSAGNGAFYDKIKHPNKKAIDISPAPGAKRITKADWLTYSVPNKYKKVLVVGNPPFGRYQKTANAFIRHALSFSNVQTIAFILPNVFNKYTKQKILPSNWRIVSITPLERNAFLIRGRIEFHIPSCFFVFDKSKGKDLRMITDGIKSNDFCFGHSGDYDFFVFGAAPKKITKNPRTSNRGYFIKAKIPVEKLIKRIKNMEWSGHSCASGGVYWLTKHEFMLQYINRYEK